MVVLTLNDVSQRLTEEVIEKAFKMKTKDIVKCIEISRAAPAGEGLLGAVYRIKVTGQKNTAFFIAKGLVGDKLLRKSLDCPKYFRREAFFFSTILPTLLELEKLLGAKHSIQNQVPQCYSCHIDGENDFILMEDLSESNCIGVSANPTKHERDAILNVLAHLHAVSMALRIKKPNEYAGFVNALPEIYFNEQNRDWYKHYLEMAIDIDKTVFNECENPKSIYYKTFFELVDTNDLYSQFIEMVNTRSEHSVLNHGDAWCPNFLYSKDRAVAVDFQLVRNASPATDLSFFLILCGNQCKEKEDFLEAVEVYYRSLEFYLKDLGFNANEVFSRDELNSELRRFGKFGLLASLTSIPLMASERCDVLQTFEEKFSGVDKIPLEDLWELTPLKTEEEKMLLVNAVRVTVDVGLI